MSQQIIRLLNRMVSITRIREINLPFPARSFRILLVVLQVIPPYYLQIYIYNYIKLQVVERSKSPLERNGPFNANNETQEYRIVSLFPDT
jgi:hypothetical protein